MKYLYLQILRLRVWLLRRRLRRMGFREAADRTNAQTLLHLKMDHAKRPTRILRWIEVAILIAGLAIWLIFYLRIAEPIQITVPKSSFPEAITPQHRPLSNPTTRNPNS